MAKANNVVLFPKTNHRLVDPYSPPPNSKEVDENIDQNKQYHIQETINFLIPIIFSHLNIAGFVPNEESEFSIKEGAFIVESIRSHMFSHYKLHHPFQKIVEKIFIKEKENDHDVFTIARNIKVSLND